VVALALTRDLGGETTEPAKIRARCACRRRAVSAACERRRGAPVMAVWLTVRHQDEPGIAEKQRRVLGDTRRGPARHTASSFNKNGVKADMLVDKGADGLHARPAEPCPGERLECAVPLVVATGKQEPQTEGSAMPHVSPPSITRSRKWKPVHPSLMHLGCPVPRHQTGTGGSPQERCRTLTVAVRGPTAFRWGWGRPSRPGTACLRVSPRSRPRCHIAVWLSPAGTL